MKKSDLEIKLEKERTEIEQKLRELREKRTRQAFHKALETGMFHKNTYELEGVEQHKARLVASNTELYEFIQPDGFFAYDGVIITITINSVVISGSQIEVVAFAAKYSLDVSTHKHLQKIKTVERRLRELNNLLTLNNAIRAKKANPEDRKEE